MPVERREQAIDIESGQPMSGPTRGGRNPMFNGRRQPSRGGTSRMMREYQVRICERLGVKLPGPTRPLSRAKRKKRRHRAKTDFDPKPTLEVSLFSLSSLGDGILGEDLADPLQGGLGRGLRRYVVANDRWHAPKPDLPPPRASPLAHSDF